MTDFSVLFFPSLFGFRL